METGIGTLDDARVKTETAWGQQRGRFAQIRKQALLQSGKLLPGDQGKGKASGVQDLDGMREAETIGIQVSLTGGLMHPPMHDIMGQEQSVEFLSDQSGFFTA